MHYPPAADKRKRSLRKALIDDERVHYHWSSGEPVFIRVNTDKDCLADSERFTAEYIVGYFGEH